MKYKYLQKLLLLCLFYGLFNITIGCKQGSLSLNDFKDGVNQPSNSNDDQEDDSNHPNSANDDQEDDSNHPDSTNDNQSDEPKRKTTINFRAFHADDGSNISDLRKQDLILKEDAVTVNNYTLSRRNKSYQPQLEIVFVIDVTTTMANEIRRVKESIIDFVNNLDSIDVETQLCLVTFSDFLEKKCDAFVNDVASTTDNENLLQFIADIHNIVLDNSNGRGGGQYMNENSLGGLLSAAYDTPWSQDSQRMAVLITDAWFWDADGNKKLDPIYDGITEGDETPSYSDVLNALNEKGVQVFAVTPDLPGFSRDYDKSVQVHFSPFGGWPSYDQEKRKKKKRGKRGLEPSLVEYTGGQWFDIERLNRNEITINDIYDYIINQVQTFYRIKYLSSDNPGLTVDNIDQSQIFLENAENNLQIRIQNIYSKTIE